jgi:hypothetical protein
LIDETSSSCENIGIKNQKVKRSKAFVVSNGNTYLEFMYMLEDMGTIAWRLILGVKYETLITTTLSCVSHHNYHWKTWLMSLKSKFVDLFWIDVKFIIFMLLM